MGFALTVENPTPVELAEVTADQGSFAEGEPTQITLGNTGDTAVRDIEVVPHGELADRVQLAINDNGKPGLWADPGFGIVIPLDGGAVLPREAVTFWAKAVFDADDVEGLYQGQFIVHAVSIGE